MNTSKPIHYLNGGWNVCFGPCTVFLVVYCFVRHVVSQHDKRPGRVLYTALEEKEAQNLEVVAFCEDVET